MSDIIHVPLNRLALWDGNVRKTDITVGITELANSIATHGLLQSLVVRKGKRDKYEIVAGQRRYLALQHLVESRFMAADSHIPCLLAQAELDAAEVSLAENVMRAPMHPADQFQAFRAVIDGGASVADVAARFSIAESTVAKRLKLARLSPVIFAAFRDGEIDLEDAQGFAVTDDHEAQERVFEELGEWNRYPDAIRRALTEHEVPSSDKRVRFVGIDAYRDAGGIVRQDLFDERNTVYLTDIPLLDRMVAEKLAVSATEVSDEGWHWVETMPDADYATLAGFRELHPSRIPLNDADQQELDRLSEEYDALLENDDADQDRLSELEQRIDELNDGTEIWPPETLAVAGVVISLDRDGDIRITRGLVRKSDLQKLKSPDDASVEGTARTSSGLSSRLVEDLTAQRSAAIGAELISQPIIALAAVVHALALDAFRPGYDTSCLKLRFSRSGLGTVMSSPDDCVALAVIEQQASRVAEHIPQDAHALFDWLLTQTCEELLEMLAIFTAMSVDTVQRKSDREDSLRLTSSQAIARALRLDIGNWFTPTAGNYFSKVSRAQILADIDEAKGTHAPSLDKLKKSELALHAERLVVGSGWLPKPLRNVVADADDAVPLAAE